MKRKEYIGIILGGIYGLIFRMLCERSEVELFGLDIFSISFIWILPIAIGLIPLLIAREEMANSRYKQVLYPIYSVLMFFLMAMVRLLEDLVCILILTFPFILVAGLTGFIVGKIHNRKNSKKLLSIILLPFLFAPIEAHFSNQKSSYTVESSITIEASKSEIWTKIIEVPEIEESEYNYGFYNYIGIPRPVKSQLEEIEGEEYRIGYFTDDLKLFEKIVEIDTLNYVEFEIELDKSQLRDLPTDKHILQSEYFKFENISYQLIEGKNGETDLKLKCNYSMESKMNWYANFWAERIIQDFEIKLLQVLKAKIEK